MYALDALLSLQPSSFNLYTDSKNLASLFPDFVTAFLYSLDEELYTLFSQTQALIHSRMESFFIAHQIRSVAQSCPTLCDPMNRSTPGLPVHHQAPEFTQTHVHRLSDAIQPSHSLSSPSPPAPNPSKHQSLFQ